MGCSFGCFDNDSAVVKDADNVRPGTWFMEQNDVHSQRRDAGWQQWRAG